jgi:ATP-dependent exoDNAse (exonuclease V) alpha subunit
LEDKNKKMITRPVKRRQFPMTAAYTFTDYRSQGQTILLVLVDIASPPNGGLSLFNLYVALSRSSGRSTIRLLQDFDDEVFLRSHDAALMEEDKRLEELNRITLEWWARMRRLDDA